MPRGSRQGGDTSMEEEEHIREVCAQYGAAMYLVQCLEHAIVNVLVTRDLFLKQTGPMRAAGSTKEDMYAVFDTYISAQFKKTMGNLIRHLKTVSAVPEYVEDALGYTKERRDFLAHSFFRERAEQFVTSAGRDEMLAELKKDQKLFSDMDEIVMSFADHSKVKRSGAPE